jgi:hypothetical protein
VHDYAHDLQVLIDVLYHWCELGFALCARSSDCASGIVFPVVIVVVASGLGIGCWFHFQRQKSVVQKLYEDVAAKDGGAGSGGGGDPEDEPGAI